MRTMTIIKVIFTFFCLMLMGFFVYENLEPIPIWIPFVKDRHIGLIYIILIVYLIGVFNAVWAVIWIGGQRKKRMKLEEIPEHEQVLFEDGA